MLTVHCAAAQALQPQLPSSLALGAGVQLNPPSSFKAKSNFVKQPMSAAGVALAASKIAAATSQGIGGWMQFHGYGVSGSFPNTNASWRMSETAPHLGRQFLLPAAPLVAACGSANCVPPCLCPATPSPAFVHRVQLTRYLRQTLHSCTGQRSPASSFTFPGPAPLMRSGARRGCRHALRKMPCSPAYTRCI